MPALGDVPIFNGTAWANAGQLSLPGRRFRPRRPQLSVVSAFASGHGWAASGSGQTLSSLTADPYVPDASARITLTAAGGWQLISPNPTTLDIGVKDGPQRALAVAARLTGAKADMSNQGQAIAYMANGSEGGPVLFGTNVGIPDNEWDLVPVQFQYQASRDLSALTQFSINGGFNASKTGIFDMGMFATWMTDGISRAVVFLDDGRTDNYEMARRAWAKGIKTTIAVIPGELGNSGFLTVAQCLELQEKYGVEFVFHARTLAEHDNTALYQDPTAFEANLKGGRDLLLQYGLLSGIEHYACAPNWAGTRDDAASKTAGALVDKYYPGLIRLAMSGYNADVQNQAPFGTAKRIRTGMFQSGTNSALSNLQGMLDRTVFMDGVAVLVFHTIGAADSFLTISRTNFDAYMAELTVARTSTAAGGISTPVRSCTFTEAFAA